MAVERQQFKLAIPVDIKDWLENESAKNMRSQSAEILLAIREKMTRQKDEKSGTTAS